MRPPKQGSRNGKTNLTDPDSRIMHTRDGFRQAFNGQAVVTSDQVIVAAEVVPDNFDFDAFHPMLDTARRTWTRPGWPIRSGRSWPMLAIPTSRTEPDLLRSNNPIC